MGFNEAGFAIMNTASYNLNGNDGVKNMDREGELMRYALERCKSVDDFENLLKTLPKPLGVEANFGVIDAAGNGAYFGGHIPYESKYCDEAFEIATNAVEAIDGIRGFVGVDLLINADEKDVYSVYLLEINSRFTTPYVGLRKICNFNIGKSIVEIIDGKMDIDDLDTSLNGEVKFMKSADSLEIRRL